MRFPPSRRLVMSLAVLCALVLMACGAREPVEEARAVEPPAEGSPRLIVLVTIDQLYGGYIDRFRPLFDSGLQRLLGEGTWFSDAHQAYARTTTSPGHATIATGRHPSTHGIVDNNWYQRDERDEVYSCDDEEFGRSPRRMQSPAIGDLLKERWPESKVFAVAGKDRSSILTAGHHADGAFWYDTTTGGFTSSQYYPAVRDSDAGEPAWLAAFHDRKLVDGLFGTTWEPVLALEEMEAYGVRPLDFGLFERKFPRAFGYLSMQPDRSFYSAVYGSPMSDWAVMQMAKAMIAGEGLGKDQYPDLLSIGLSALDATGHGYGPDSPEMLDTLLRVDRLLGELFESLERQVGLEHVVIALSSDHGVGRVPEVVLAEGEDAGRFGASQVLCFQRLGLEIGRTYGIDDLEWMPELGYLDHDLLAERQVDIDALTRELVAGLGECERIDAVYTLKEIDAATTPRLELFKRSTYPGRSPDLSFDLTPNTLATSSTASHGSPNRYDTWVPWIQWGAGAAAQKVAVPVETVDIVPTLGSLYGIEWESDGRSRANLLRGIE